MTTVAIPGLQSAITEALTSVPHSEVNDIYAISFYIYDEDDDPRRPTVTVGYNTVQQWQASRAQASSSSEAKWNYAFWLQNALLTFGEAGSPSAAAVAAWAADLGLAYTDRDEDADLDRCLELGEQITSHFVAAVCKVASAMHHDGLIARVFARPLPIIVHELEYYDEIADQTEQCNPPGVAAEFVAWVQADCP